MRKIFVSFAFLMLTVLTSQSLFAQTTTLSGQITNSVGVPISNVPVTVQSIASYTCPDSIVTVHTNSFGNYSTTINYYCSILVVPNSRKYTFTPQFYYINSGWGPYTGLDFVGYE